MIWLRDCHFPSGETAGILEKQKWNLSQNLRVGKNFLKRSPLINSSARKLENIRRRCFLS
ncbi:hypothetical protein NECAME_10226 [Necator americanus]|uniref:Uncharacterized protein n=1 Tax=Necator americanus TaxID=51031 RepID=W2TBP7_NECAM|nr:hypothetical protein NECAME_10226 [Necator americanus]ETN78621.1 hypothetical protein NECAME_10226 [Necator americanus]